METVIGVFFGGLITILTPIFVEYQRLPRLGLSIEAPPYDATYGGSRPATRARYLRLRLTNEPLPSGRAMTVRWVSSPEPVPIRVISPDGTQFQIIDPVRLTLDSRI